MDVSRKGFIAGTLAVATAAAQAAASKPVASIQGFNETI